jgi:hypothetical protein
MTIGCWCCYFRFGRNVTKMGKTSDMFALVNWNTERVDQLIELYSVAPLNMHCLDHSGMLFPVSDIEELETITHYCLFTSGW